MKIDFDELDARLERSQPKRNQIAFDTAIINPDVARRVARGDAIMDIADDLGVAEATLRKRLAKTSMKELVGIEQRRIMLHLTNRDLSKEKYLALATAATNFMNAELRAQENEMGIGRNQTINQNFIERIDILIQRSEGQGGGIRDLGPAERIAEEGIPETPEQPECGRQDGTGEPDECGGEEQER